ncbi:MAG: hypothetical protein O3A53_19635 [Acidobacteria bacterium]|nr:hypothetical protein [Acidobacteriota bacterium]MDA1236995.1 hypothetical protein [Acidobacteriota bacterium]
MFERYTEKARGVIFLARFETSRFGTAEIETEHVLLGLLSQDKALLDRLLGTAVDVAPIAARISDRTPMGEEGQLFADVPLPVDLESLLQQIRDQSSAGEKIPVARDVALSTECKRVLMFTAEEANQLDHKHIDTEHLLLGLLLEHGCFAAEILRGLGFSLEKVREDLAKRSNET